MFDHFEREVRVQQNINHPNLVRVLDVVYHPDLIFLIMEYCPNGDLCQYIADRLRLDEVESRRIFVQLVDALVYLHARSIAHRDLKPNNILMDQFSNPKIADFGLCHYTDAKSLLNTPCGSIFYAAPEILSEQEYNGQLSDVWSLGVVLYSMLTSALPWTSTNQALVLKQILNGDLSLSLIISTDIYHLLSKMLTFTPEFRPTMMQVSQHPWVSDDKMMIGRSQHQLGSDESQPRLRFGMPRRVVVRPERSFSDVTVVPQLTTPPSSDNWQLLRRQPQTKQAKPALRALGSFRCRQPVQLSFVVAREVVR
jgi:serine/threonine protein kinase